MLARLSTAAAGVAALVAWLAASSCSVPPHALVCESNAQCMRGDVQGTCLPPGHCAFSDSNCESGLRWDDNADDGLAGRCVEGVGADAGPRVNQCGGKTVLLHKPGTPCGVCKLGVFQCVDPNRVACVGEPELEVAITGDGQVAASSQLDGAGPELAVDGDASTSWFSTGPEPGGGPTLYTWSGSVDACISEVWLRGNAEHADSHLRSGTGFGEVTVEVADAFGNVVFRETVALDGTPDPPMNVATGGVLGRTVTLQLSGHEAEDRAGFSELGVKALRDPAVP